MNSIRPRYLFAPLGVSLFLFLVLASAALAAPAGIHGHRGAAVGPRSFRFDDLPRRAPSPPGIVAREHDETALPPGLEAQMEEAKAHPRGPTREQLGQLTLVTEATAIPPTTINSFTTGTGFEGITQGAGIPSEPTVGAGPLNVFSAGNSSITVTNKDGTGRVEVDDATFFGIPASEGVASDAVCYYDAVHGRFLALAFTDPGGS
jgi:hypothetical protein